MCSYWGVCLLLCRNCSSLLERSLCFGLAALFPVWLHTGGSLILGWLEGSVGCRRRFFYFLAKDLCWHFFCGTAKNIFCTSFALLLRWSYFIFLIKRACSALVPGLLLHPIWFENMLVPDTTAGLNKACNIAYLTDFVLILVRED